MRPCLPGQPEDGEPEKSGRKHGSTPAVCVTAGLCPVKAGTLVQGGDQAYYTRQV